MTRTDPVDATDAAIEQCIFALLATRQDGATVCPSEVARALAPDGGRWRALMPQVRAVAQRLALARRLQVTRGGVPVDATQPGGPIRLGRSRQGG
ncbi:DUF3253 domain-containing protein [Pseudorhodoferax sp.]|uniref:DUF3253 domain-containing protein n=1 Tax=Pseudorhodoferax sp. TaxID=1993553 RepID=UPI002DD6A5F1|nr:DUF3253 domain-containing protein [Pseudorhodoferax sp.]